MVSASRISIAAGLVCALAAVAGSPAFAGCKRMAFSVNDYGKDGPTKDSQDLLDKHIATWATEQGIEKFTVGKKETTCELFLNFIVFDEHTCTTRATVCWGGDKLPSGQVAKSTPKDTPSKPTDKAEKTADATPGKPVEKAIETSTPVSAEAAKPAGTTADAKPIDTSTSTPAAAQTSVETGTIPLSNKTSEPVAPPKTADAAATSENVTVSDRDAVSAAAAAAERAADAAERAAAAAEKALATMEKVAAEAKSQSASAGGAGSALVAPVQPSPTIKP